MRFISALSIVVFVTIPSVIYSVSNWAFTIVLFPLGLIHQVLMGEVKQFHGKAQRMVVATAIIKIVSPLFLVIVIPLILYISGRLLLTWIFGGWMILYFIIRRWSGVSRTDPRGFQSYKATAQLDDRINKVTDSPKETEENL